MTTDNDEVENENNASVESIQSPMTEHNIECQEMSDKDYESKHPNADKFKENNLHDSKYHNNGFSSSMNDEMKSLVSEIVEAATQDALLIMSSESTPEDKRNNDVEGTQPKILIPDYEKSNIFVASEIVKAATKDAMLILSSDSTVLETEGKDLSKHSLDMSNLFTTSNVIGNLEPSKVRIDEYHVENIELMTDTNYENEHEKHENYVIDGENIENQTGNECEHDDKNANIVEIGNYLQSENESEIVDNHDNEIDSNRIENCINTVNDADNDEIENDVQSGSESEENDNEETGLEIIEIEIDDLSEKESNKGDNDIMDEGNTKDESDGYTDKEFGKVDNNGKDEIENYAQSDDEYKKRANDENDSYDVEIEDDNNSKTAYERDENDKDNRDDIENDISSENDYDEETEDSEHDLNYASESFDIVKEIKCHDFESTLDSHQEALRTTEKEQTSSVSKENTTSEIKIFSTENEETNKFMDEKSLETDSNISQSIHHNDDMKFQTCSTNDEIKEEMILLKDPLIKEDDLCEEEDIIKADQDNKLVDSKSNHINNSFENVCELSKAVTDMIKNDTDNSDQLLCADKSQFQHVQTDSCEESSNKSLSKDGLSENLSSNAKVTEEILKSENMSRYKCQDIQERSANKIHDINESRNYKETPEETSEIDSIKVDQVSSDLGKQYDSEVDILGSNSDTKSFINESNNLITNNVNDDSNSEVNEITEIGNLMEQCKDLQNYLEKRNNSYDKILDSLGCGACDSNTSRLDNRNTTESIGNVMHEINTMKNEEKELGKDSIATADITKSFKLRRKQMIKSPLTKRREIKKLFINQNDCETSDILQEIFNPVIQLNQTKEIEEIVPEPVNADKDQDSNDTKLFSEIDENSDNSRYSSQEFLTCERMSFPWVKVTFLLLISTIGMIIADTQLHGHFRSTSLGHFLSDLGLLARIEDTLLVLKQSQAWSSIRSHAILCYEFISTLAAHTMVHLREMDVAETMSTFLVASKNQLVDISHQAQESVQYGIQYFRETDYTEVKKSVLEAVDAAVMKGRELFRDLSSPR